MKKQGQVETLGHSGINRHLLVCSLNNYDSILGPYEVDGNTEEIMELDNKNRIICKAQNIMEFDTM